MDKVISISKIMLLSALIAVAVICILSEPAGSNWLLTLLISKVVGFACGYAAFRLSERWKDDTLISRFYKFL